MTKENGSLITDRQKEAREQMKIEKIDVYKRQHLKRTGTDGEVSHTPDLGFYRVKYPVKGEPLISIIIPNKDEKESLEACLKSIWEKTTYKNYEIIVVENNSTSDEIFRYYKEISKKGVRLLRWKKEFNYSAINNFGAAHAKGEFLLFLNNDVTVITPDWLTERCV